MNVKVYGYYLITGESIPLDDALRLDVERQLAGTVRHLAARTTEVQVLVAEVIGRRGGFEKRCRVKAHLNRDREPTADGSGATVREAVMRAIDRLARALCRSASREPATVSPSG